MTETALAAHLADSNVASVLLPPGIKADATARGMVKHIQDADRPALIAGDADLRAQLQADGLHLADPANVAALRKQLGDGVIIGAECPLERHACMVAAEDGADYVAIRVTLANRAEALEHLAWWQEMMTVPIVALIDAAMETAQIEASADFVSLPAA